MSLRAAASAAVLFAGVAACDGCKGTSKAAVGSNEAGTDAAALAAGSSSSSSSLDAGPARAADRTLVTIAEGSAEVRFFRTFDGGVVVMAGGIPYEGKANGALEPIVLPAGLAPMFPDDEALVGFLEPSVDVHWVYGDLAEKGTLFLDGIAGTRKTLAVRDRKLVPATAFEARHVVRWRGKLLGANFTSKMNGLEWLEDKSEPAPTPSSKLSIITSLAVDKQGALIAVSHGSYEALRAAVYPSTWKPGDAPTIIDGPTFASCSLVPSFDASAVMMCSEAGKNRHAFLRVAQSGFERIFPDAPEEISAASIGKDGALYVTYSSKLAVERCPAPTGKCTPLEVKSDFGTLSTAHYEQSATDVVERKGDDIGERSWTTVRLDPPRDKEEIKGSYSILARDADDIWLLARSYRRAVVLHATDDPKRERARLPSRLDGRVLARNARAPQLWTGHCDQVFVRLSQDDAKKTTEIEKALGVKQQSYEAPFHWWPVEGRLHEDKVSGVVIVHRDIEEPLEKMERATEKLVAAFTDNPMRKPSVYCTLPVLDRVLQAPTTGQ